MIVLKMLLERYAFLYNFSISDLFCKCITLYYFMDYRLWNLMMRGTGEAGSEFDC